MSNTLSTMDRELLGEVIDGGEANLAKAHGGPRDGAFEGSNGATFTPLNATAGTLIKVSSKGDVLEPGSETVTGDTKAVPKTPKKRRATTAANGESSQPAKKRSSTNKATSTTNEAGLDSVITAKQHSTTNKGTSTTNDDDADSVTAAKKRAPPKGKVIANVSSSTGDGETDGETEGLEPVTPKKGKRATTKAKAIKAENEDNGPAESTGKSASPAKANGAVEGMTVHNTPRKRQAPKKEISTPRGIPGSWDEAGDADRMLVTMKEQGEGWSEIRAAWKAATGQDTASSTLPNRYNRLKVNMMHMKAGDEPHLLAAKKEVEDAYHANFWANVSAAMERRGADKYPAAFVQKTFKELEANGDAGDGDDASKMSGGIKKMVKGLNANVDGKEEENGDGDGDEGGRQLE